MKRKVMNQPGFTLLEVLIALVILALAFSASYFSMNASTRHIINLQNKTAAGWVGWNVIEKAKLGIIPVQKGGSIDGSDDMFDSTWHWKLTISPTPNTFVMKMTVDVSKTATSTKIIQVTGYLFNRPGNP